MGPIKNTDADFFQEILAKLRIAGFISLDPNQGKNTNCNYNSKCMLNNMRNSRKSIILRSVLCVFQKTFSNSFPISQKS